MSDQLPAPPRPEPPPEHEPYWAALREHRLVLQRCTACGTIRHYPRPMCSACYSLEHEWINASGRGTVCTWTVSHHAFHPGFKKDLPYVTVTVDLEEGVRLQAPLRGHDGEPSMGLAVQIDYEDVDEGLTVPCFRPL